MAFTLTTYLRLRLDDNLTTNARYNLERIDEIGARILTTQALDTNVNSRNNINLLPENTNVGGSGSGGTVTVGSSSQTISLLQVYASSLAGNFNLSTTGDLRIVKGDYYTGFTAPSSALSSNLMFSLPDADGASSQVLGTDGNGGLGWYSVLAANLTPARVVISNAEGNVSVSSVTADELTFMQGITSGVQDQIDTLTTLVTGKPDSETATWANADGTSKTVAHSFGTRNVAVTILDNSDNYNTIEVDIDRTSTDEIVLTSSSAPATTWSVILQEGL